MNKDLIAFTCICEDDAHWIPQYLREVERLDIPFGIHLDRCSSETKEEMAGHRNCLAFTIQDDSAIEYTEQHKQAILDAVCAMPRKRKWALHWDIDEVWEDAFLLKFDGVKQRSETHLRVLWINTWEDMKHVRYDPVEPPGLMRPSPRVKLYRIDQGITWRFDHPVIYGCKVVGADGKCRRHDGLEGDTDIGCIHTGLMTHELRKQHAERWDRVYGAAVGENPYSLWHSLMDPVKHPPTVIPNKWRRMLV